MTQIHMIVVPFRPKTDWNRLRAAVAEVPHASLDSADRAAIMRLGGDQKQITYWDHAYDDRLRRIAEELGFRVNGLVPRPLIEITIEPAKGKKQEFDRMRQEIERRGALKSTVLNKQTVLAHGDFDEQVSVIITQCGYKQKFTREDP